METYRLKWSGHQPWAAGALASLHQDSSLADITLLSSDLTVFQAHRLLLAAASPFFSSITALTPRTSDPFLYLKGVSSSSLGLILTFMYRGEVEVPGDQVTAFLEAAQDLKVQGLEAQPGGDQDRPKETDTDQDLKPKNRQKCPHCEKTFSKSGWLKYHLNAAHSNVTTAPKYECKNGEKAVTMIEEEPMEMENSSEHQQVKTIKTELGQEESNVDPISDASTTNSEKLEVEKKRLELELNSLEEKVTVIQETLAYNEESQVDEQSNKTYEDTKKYENGPDPKTKETALLAAVDDELEKWKEANADTLTNLDLKSEVMNFTNSETLETQINGVIVSKVVDKEDVTIKQDEESSERTDANAGEDLSFGELNSSAETVVETIVEDLMTFNETIAKLQSPKVDCKDCGKSFKSKYSLKSHIESVHVGKTGDNPRVDCKECGRSLKNKESLKIHMDSIHLGLLAMNCMFCDKSFTQKTNCTTHMKKWHTEEWAAYKGRRESGEA